MIRAYGAPPVGLVGVSFALRRGLAGKRLHIVNQIPDVLIGLDFAKGRHTGQADRVLNNPEQFAIRVLLDREWIGCFEPSQINKSQR